LRENVQNTFRNRGGGKKEGKKNEKRGTKE